MLAIKLMTNTFWIGVYPGLTNEMIDYILSKFEEFLGDDRNAN